MKFPTHIVMRETVKKLWPEIDWIGNPTLREQVTQTWIKALEHSPLQSEDLNQIPFTLLVPNCPITFMEHKRCVVHIARDSAKAMQNFMGRPLPVDLDVVIAGAILADVGKLLEYELGPDGKSRQSDAERHCVIRLQELPSRWNAECRTPSVTSSPPTPPKATSSSAQRRRSSCITRTSWRFCLSRIQRT